MKKRLIQTIICILLIFILSVTACAYTYDAIWGSGLDEADIEARNALKKAAEQLIDPGDDDVIRVIKLNQYVCDRARYDDRNEYGGLTEFQKSGRIACLGYAETLSYLLDCAGVKNVTVTAYVTPQNAPPALHIWNVVSIGGEWFHVDPTWNDETRSEHFPNGRYFLRSLSDINAERPMLVYRTKDDFDRYYRLLRTASVSIQASSAKPASDTENEIDSRKSSSVYRRDTSHLEKSDSLSFVQNGVFFASVREIAFSLGGYVKEGADGEMTVILGTKTLNLKAESLRFTVDGEGYLLNEPPKMVNGVLMAPIRGVFEKMGAAVTYDQDTREATISFSPC